MPLLLYGARQVGKTYILTEFGEKYFNNTVYVNLETNLSVARYFDDDITPERLIRFLETTVNDEIIPDKTLIMQAGVVLKCQKIEHAQNPISVYADLSSFKLYMSDVGLLVMKSGLAQQTILTGESNIFMGAVTENYIAQALVSNGYTPYYWTSEHSAELDFVIQKDSGIVGIEVKKSTSTKSKSLGVFIQKYQPTYSIRFSEKNFGQYGGIQAIPHYAAFCL